MRARRRFGASSNSYPGLSLEQLDEVVAAVGGSVVDLRADRHQAWERGFSRGWLPRCAVAFLAIDHVLGQPITDEDDAWLQIAARERIPVRVALPSATTATALADTSASGAAALFDRGVEVLIETHYPGLDLGVFMATVTAAAVGVVADTWGMERMELTHAERLSVVSVARALQVKGFGGSQMRGGDVSSLAGNHARLEELLSFTDVLPAAAAITLETRPHLAMRDLAALARTMRAVP